MTALASGAVLNERYQLKHELGQGGMGTVFRGHDPQLDRDIAIKILTALGLGTDGRNRLLAEAQSIAKLNHTNIVAVYDVGEVESIPYIVMELVEGRDLHRAPPADLPQMVGIARQICLALQHAHQQDIVHRDLKPENVLVLADGTVKLVDFGIARSVASRMTAEGQIVGTVYYLAPELALGQDYDGRADLYALGVMLYELAVGSLPFDKGDALTIVSQHIHAAPVPPRARNSEIPPRFESLILQLLAKDPNDRPPSAAAVVKALDDPELLDLTAAADEELAVLGRIARGRFVGRQKELKQARAIWTQTMAGAGQTLLISGEPGIGKSSLTRELATQAEITGGKALIGECYAEGGAPYLPFSQILRKLLPKHSQNGSTVPDFVIADLITLTPELRPYFDELPKLPALDPESEQRRLSESMVTLFSKLSEDTPVLLVIEDAHWADSSSLTMLRYLARRTRGQQIMLVATYREVELDESLPLQEMLVELNRERLASRMKLTRFGKDETRELLATIFQDVIGDEFLEGIYAETEGNPFFIEEVCKALVEEGKLFFEDGEWHRPDMSELDIPQSVRVAVQSRLSKLPGSVQDNLRMAAILGREFDFETLIAASELSEDNLIEVLEIADRAQLIDEISGESGGTFRFAHALISTTLVEGLSGLRRRRMHHQAATAIEELRPNDYEALAHHYYESGDIDKGLEYSLQAGERALAFSSNSEAMRHFKRALEIADVGERPDELLAIYMGLGEIEGVADFNLALSYYDKALALTEDPVRQAIIKVKIGRLQAVTGDERGFSLLEEAISTLDPATHGNELAQGIASIGRFHHNRGQHQQAIEQLERAREIADPLGDLPTLIYVYTFLAGAYQHLANFERSNEWARRQVELGQNAKYAFMEAVGNEYLAENHSFLGQWEKALEFARQDLELGVKNGLLERVRWAHLVELWALRNLGQTNRATESGRLCLEQAESAGDARLAVLAGEYLARALADRGELDTAQQYAEESTQRALELDQAYMIAESHASLSHLQALRGEWDQALESAQVAMDMPADSDNRLIPMVAGPALAEAMIEVGRADETEALLVNVLAIARESNSAHFEAASLRVLGRLQTHRNEFDQAEESFSQALKLCEEWKSQIMAGRVLLDWAALEILRGSGADGSRRLEQARETFKSTEATYWIERTSTALSEGEPDSN